MIIPQRCYPETLWQPPGRLAPTIHLCCINIVIERALLPCQATPFGHRESVVSDSALDISSGDGYFVPREAAGHFPVLRNRHRERDGRFTMQFSPRCGRDIGEGRRRWRRPRAKHPRPLRPLWPCRAPVRAAISRQTQRQSLRPAREKTTLRH